MSEPKVLVEKAPGDPRVARIVLNRPDVRNAWDGDLVTLLQRALRDLASDESVRVVELSGAGPAFCAGADLEWMKRVANFTMEENRRDSAELAQLFRALDELDKPVVARVQGAALGGGTGLVAACDVVVAAEGAIFGTTEVRLGIIPAVIAPYVIRKIGESHARHWFLTGERVGAEEARRVGLVHHVVPEKELARATAAVIDAILLGGPVAVQEAKRLVHAVGTLPPREAAAWAIQRMAERRGSHEGLEGLKAFLEKRAAVWTTKGS
ncbi:MAG TPA: enoyl-CoA hydratase-related protein [Thermoanaerobaculia bacterium]|nr:enoyl-CoA hydratase-related protein [Thermoanaerobaculia bacterium]